MTDNRIITLVQISQYFNVNIDIIRDFAEIGLCTIIVCDGEAGIEAEALGRLWKSISLYQSLGVNKEGIEIILDLRQKISELQEQVDTLQYKAEKLRTELLGEVPETLKGRGLLIEIED